MNRSETTEIRCPVCAALAEAIVRRSDRDFETPHGEVMGYCCPNGRDVDPGTLRTMLGAE